jgi:hyaluronan synthase
MGEGRPFRKAAHRAREVAPVLATLCSVLLVVAAAADLESVEGPWIPLAAVGSVTVWAWAYRRWRAASYRPIANQHWDAATVVAPAFRESAATLERAVSSWLLAGAAEVVLVVPADEELSTGRALGALRDARLRVVATEEPTKRNCIAVGVRAASHPIVVLADSDTIWEPVTLQNLLMPFADRSVGAVGSRHRVVDAESSLWRRVADWTLGWEFGGTIPATASAGSIATVKGRTVAYRRGVLLSVLPDLLGETFLGRKCLSGDDGRLTWLLLQRGYKTVHQATAVAWTVMPANARGFLMQRLRWGRNSYRCYLRASLRGWLFRQPLMTQMTVVQKLIFPVSVTGGLTFGVMSMVDGYALGAVAWTTWTFSGRGVRLWDLIRGRGGHLRDLPALAAILVLLTAAIKYYCLFTLTRQDWMTRRPDRIGAEGQPQVPDRKPTPAPLGDTSAATIDI